MTLVRYEAARVALQEAKAVDEAKDIHDKAEAVRAYARQANDTEMVSWASEIKLRAMRRMGELLKEGQQAGEIAPPHRPGKVSAPSTLTDLGVTRNLSSISQKIAAVPEEEFDAHLEELREQHKEVTVAGVARLVQINEKMVRRQERIENIGDRALATDSKYPIIYADPPWRYEHPSGGASSRAIENQYPTMTLEEICALPVRDLATEDALLYIWATAPKLTECMEVINSWDFEYRTNVVWDKEIIGMGYYARNQHELLLIAKRGNIPPPLAGTQPSSVHHERRGKHSVKPIFYYEMIENAYPDLPKIELFSRDKREGWASWGNQSK